MKSIKTVMVSAVLGATALVSPASAGTIVMTGSSSTSGTAGLIRSFSDGAGISVQASAFSIVGGNLQTAYLGAYSGGLGVTNSIEGNGSSNNSHTIDNVGSSKYSSFDFVLLVFNKAVNLSTAALSPFKVGSTSADNDAFVTYGNLANAFKNTPTAVSLSNVLSIANNANGKNIAGNLSSGNLTSLNNPNAYANIWVIGAARSGYNVIDSKADGFKLKSIKVVAGAVPEPATWGMMICGMGIAGVALRRRRRAFVSRAAA